MHQYSHKKKKPKKLKACRYTITSKDRNPGMKPSLLELSDTNYQGTYSFFMRAPEVPKTQEHDFLSNASKISYQTRKF